MASISTRVDVLVPGAVQGGWVLFERPDGNMMREGPVAECERLLRGSLTLLVTPPC